MSLCLNTFPTFVVTINFFDSGPCVMMTSPGILQNGFSRELLESWAEDSRNGLVVAGYVVEGTLGKTIISDPVEIPTMTGGKLKRRLSVSVRFLFPPTECWIH
jgi:cleavage and polyadenylation specificity factor subunit 3